MEELIIRRVKTAIQQKLFPGCVVGVIRKNGDRVILPIGKQTYQLLSRSIRKDFIFDIASITKAIPLAMVTIMA